MKPNIRPITQEDMPAIGGLMNKLCTLENAAYDETIVPNLCDTDAGKKYLEERIEDGKDSYCLLAEIDNKIVGYIIGGIIPPEDYRFSLKLAVLESMFVEEDYRSLGVGRQFITMFEAWAKENGVDRCRLVASVKNVKAIDLYRKMGYEDYDLTLEKRV